MGTGKVQTFRSLINPDPAGREAQVYRFADSAKPKVDTFKNGKNFAETLKDKIEKPAKVADNRPPKNLASRFRNRA